MTQEDRYCDTPLKSAMVSGHANVAKVLAGYAGERSERGERDIYIFLNLGVSVFFVFVLFSKFFLFLSCVFPRTFWSCSFFVFGFSCVLEVSKPFSFEDLLN